MPSTIHVIPATLPAVESSAFLAAGYDVQALTILLATQRGQIIDKLPAGRDRDEFAAEIDAAVDALCSAQHVLTETARKRFRRYDHVEDKPYPPKPEPVDLPSVGRAAPETPLRDAAEALDESYAGGKVDPLGRCDQCGAQDGPLHECVRPMTHDELVAETLARR